MFFGILCTNFPHDKMEKNGKCETAFRNAGNLEIYFEKER